MILEKIIYSVREDLKEYTDDSELSNEYIIYLYTIKRANYIRQDLNNYQKTTDLSVTQTFCLDLELVSTNECGLNLECDKILRSKQKMPKTLDLHLKSSIISVKPTNKTSIPFNFTTKQKAIYSKYSKFNNAIFSFLDDDGYIYLLSENLTHRLIDCITVTGIFEDPLELSNYKNCCNCENSTNCYDELLSDYPLQSHYIDLIRKEIVEERLKLLNIPIDKNNNSNND